MKIKVVAIFAIVLCLGFTGKLIKVKITDALSMSMPPDFRPMTDDEIVARYFTTTRPLALFTSPDLTVDLGVNKSVTQWKESDLGIMKGFYKTNIFSLYDNVQMIDEGLREVNGRQFAFFEFVSTIKAKGSGFINKGSISKYTVIQYTIVKGNALVFNFTSPASQKSKWGPEVKDIMESINIKKSFK